MFTDWPLLNVFILCCFPYVSMMIGSILMQYVTPSPKVTTAFQRMSCGLVFGGVSCELLPILLPSTGKSNKIWGTFADVIGFFLGVSVMMLISWLTEGNEVEEETPEKANLPEKEIDQPFQPLSSETRKLPLIRSLSAPETISIQSIQPPSLSRQPSVTIQLKRALSNLVVQIEEEEKNSFEFSDLFTYDTALPYGLIFVVCVDGLTDGLSIGIASVAGSGAGLIMAAALTIEMCFLGISVSAIIASRHVPRAKALFVCAILPLPILLGGLIGSSILSNLDIHSVWYSAVVSFSVASLLWLVTEELLAEVHNTMTTDDSVNTWIVTCQFFIGFLIVLTSSRLTT